jgi:hypothetical protein
MDDVLPEDMPSLLQRNRLILFTVRRVARQQEFGRFIEFGDPKWFRCVQSFVFCFAAAFFTFCGWFWNGQGPVTTAGWQDVSYTCSANTR